MSDMRITPDALAYFASIQPEVLVQVVRMFEERISLLERVNGLDSPDIIAATGPRPSTKALRDAD